MRKFLKSFGFLIYCLCKVVEVLLLICSIYVASSDKIVQVNEYKAEKKDSICSNIQSKHVLNAETINGH